MRGLLILFLLTFLLLACQSNTGSENKIKGDNAPHKDSLQSQRALMDQGNASKRDLSELTWDSINKQTPFTTNTFKYKRTTNKKVLGWHCYEQGTSYQAYNFDLLWAVSYFSYKVNPKTGGYHSISGWRTTDFITQAQNQDCQVFMTVSNFGSDNNNLFLPNKSAQNVLADSLVTLLEWRNANGINIDFEGVPSNMRADFTSFLIDLSTKIKAANPDYQVSLCLYANDWNNVFDIKAIDAHIDFYTLMAYDYYGGFSKSTGPNTPFKYSKQYGKGLKESVDDYRKKGVKDEKLIVGLPYYGVEWATKSPQPGTQQIDFRAHPPYKRIKSYYLDTLGATIQFDTVSQSSFLVVKDSLLGYRQIYFEDTRSLGYKYDWINESRIAGVGIWALGYDYGYTELWDLLGEKFGTIE